MFNLKLKYSVLNPIIFVILLWLIKDFEEFTTYDFKYYGIFPREIQGLYGILFAPLIHGDYWHLLSNSFPILFLGTMLYYFYDKIALKTVVISYLLTNILVWCFARPSYHIGASGLVYALASFLFWSGIFRKDRRTLSISMIIMLLYGGMLQGVIPSQNGVSWESHLMGGIVGLALAFIFRKVAIWEKEEAPETPDFREVNYKYQFIPNVFKQNTNALLMIRPKSFGFNSETAITNVFQSKNELSNPVDVQNKAKEEFDNLAAKIREKGINVLAFEDRSSPVCPDAVFPNNWISFHHDGSMIKYPMEAKNRRLERRDDIIDLLHHKFQYAITRKLDFTEYESKQKYLEGTGSIVFDHLHKIAYACISSRTDENALTELCKKISYQPFTFKAQTSKNDPIYHTNVIMAMGEHFAVVCFDLINDSDKLKFREILESTNKEIIEISEKQLFKYCGNILQVENVFGKKFIVMSDSAYNNFTDQQKARLYMHGEIIHSDLTNIEYYGGGSARCMLSEIFLPKG